MPDLNEIYFPSDEKLALFYLIRGVAISRYADYEITLAHLFSHLMGVEDDVGGVPFFKMNNARARTATIERLLTKKHGTKHNLFWNSLQKEIEKLDASRNHVVHWAKLDHFDFDVSPPTVTHKLVPPNIADRNTNSPALTAEEMHEFVGRCFFIRNALVGLTHVLSYPSYAPQTWLEICQKPITCAILPENQLFRTYGALGNPIPPFGE